jgi:Flp pilus assembly pilin Flp
MIRGLLAARPAARLLVTARGQTLVEYSLILVLVAIAAILILAALGFDLSETFDRLENALGFGGPENVVAPTGDADATL